MTSEAQNEGGAPPQASPEDRLAAEMLRDLAAEPGSAPAPLREAVAQTIAAGKFRDPGLAQTALRAALQAAEDLRAQAATEPPDGVLAEIVALNDQGRIKAAAERLDAALTAGSAAAQALGAAALQQDRLRNRPDLAAQRHIDRLKAAAPAGGVFRAAVTLLYERLEAGEKAGDAFDMALALELAKLLHKRAKGPELGQAQTSLGNCHQVIGQFRPGRKHLDLAAELFTAAAKAVARTKQPENWAFAQHNLGGIQELIGRRHQDGAMLKRACAAYRAALEVFLRPAMPLEWANATAGLANAQAMLARQKDDHGALAEAIAGFAPALEELTAKDHPGDWAAAMTNLAIARGHLAEAEGDAPALRRALEDFDVADRVEASLEAPAVRGRLLHHRARNCLLLAGHDPDPDWLDRAEAGFAAALSQARRDCADFRWAESLTGLGRVALARAARGEAGQSLLAGHRLIEARRVLALDPASAALAECEALLAAAGRG